MKRYTQIRSQVRWHYANFTTRSGIAKAVPLAVVLFLTIITVTAFGVASAALPTGPVSQAEATATAGGSVTIPSPVASASAQLPAAQNTGVTNPPLAEETRLAQIAEATAIATGSTAASTSFPWLPLILLGAALLGGLLYLLSRRRTSNVVAVTPRTVAAPVTPYEPSGGPVITSTISHTTSAIPATVDEPVTPPVVTSTVSAPAPFVLPVALPSTLDCPNCGTTNDIDENFCHDCGMDLRRTRAALLDAVAPPPDVVTENTPYLETVSRIDEQLEYVLARPNVIIGTAPGSDIVIDSLFQGWQTVDPTHAELRRENEGFVLVDRGSGSGTFVNEMRTGENMLSDGDVIRVGDVRFVFRVPA